jgi:hypothetical protein
VYKLTHKLLGYITLSSYIWYNQTTKTKVMNETELKRDLSDWLMVHIQHHQAMLDRNKSELTYPQLLEKNRVRIQKQIDICSFRIKFFKQQLNNL